jgi:hypothetical protein
MSKLDHLEESAAQQLSASERAIVEGKPTSIAKAAAAKAVREAKAKAEPARKVAPLLAGDMQLAEFKQADWVCTAPAGAQPEDFDQNPEAWMLVSKNLHAYDLVRIVARDESWWGLYLCLAAGATRANAKLLMATDLPPRDGAIEANDLPVGYTIRAGDPTQCPWICVRLSDGFILNVNEAHTTYESARRWLLDSAVFRAEATTQYLP